MCSHYQGIKERERYFRNFGVYPPDDSGKYDVWPGYAATASDKYALAVDARDYWDI